jgi:hypothetical protein
VSYRNPKTGRWDKPPPRVICSKGEYDTNLKTRKEIDEWLRHAEPGTYREFSFWEQRRDPTQWRSILFVAGGLACLLAFIAVRYWRG